MTTIFSITKKFQLESKDNGDGSCSVVYVPEEEGDYEIFVKYDDVDIPDSPFKASASFSLWQFSFI